MGTRDTGTMPVRPQRNTGRATGGKQKREKRVRSVRRAVSIIQVHVKQPMYAYGIVLSSAGSCKGEEKNNTDPFHYIKKKKCAHANGGD